MFKKKAFLISLALLASNLLLPNEVKSGLEIGEEIIYEREVNNNFTIINLGSSYEGFAFPYPAPLCRGDTLNELSIDCVKAINNIGNPDNPGANHFLLIEFDKILQSLIEGEQYFDGPGEITSEEELDLIFKISRSTNGYKGSLTFWGHLEESYCEGETLNELKLDCRIESGNDKRWILKAPLDSAIHELIDPLIEEEEDIEDEQEIEEDVVVEEEVEEVLEEETAEAEDIDFDSITKDDLPLKVYCPDRGADLIIREKKKKKGFVVKITRRRGERFFDGRKFRKAVKKFKKALENEC